MKELYFTVDTLDQQANELYRQVGEVAPLKMLQVHPARSALLVLDMQAYFLDSASHAYVPSAGAILDGILQLIEAYSARHMPIFFTQHINTPGDAGMMSAWWKDVITVENRSHKIIPAIDTSLGTLIQKTQYDAFHHTPLEEMLRAREVTQVVTCGVMTHLCCETTARSAFTRGFGVFFPVDGTATYNLVYHRATLTNLAHGFASVCFVKDILDGLRGAYDG